MWFIGVEVEQETSASLQKKILDPPLGSFTNFKGALSSSVDGFSLIHPCQKSKKKKKKDEKDNIRTIAVLTISDQLQAGIINTKISYIFFDH